MVCDDWSDNNFPIDLDVCTRCLSKEDAASIGIGTHIVMTRTVQLEAYKIPL